MTGPDNGDIEHNPGNLFAQELFGMIRHRVAQDQLTADQAVCGLAVALAVVAAALAEPDQSPDKAADQVADMVRDAYLAYWTRRAPQAGEA